MFTGIVEGTGTVVDVSAETGNKSDIRMTVDLGDCGKGLEVGQSVALNGVCLTATKLAESRCVFEMIEETTRMTDLGNLVKGSPVNIERSLRAGGRLEGHFVLGHIDGTGTIKEIREGPKEVRVSVEIPGDLAKFVVKKGSIAIDGISLTVTDVQGSLVSVSLIPHTVRVTNFQTRKAGDRVNIETDILAKYVLGQGRLQL